MGEMRKKGNFIEENRIRGAAILVRSCKEREGSGDPMGRRKKGGGIAGGGKRE